MKRKIKETLGKMLQSIMDYFDDIPAPVIGRFGNTLQAIGGTLLAAAIIGFAVSGDTVQIGEAFIVGFVALGFLHYGTILDIKASK